MKIKDFIDKDFIVLYQFIGFLVFWFASSYPYKSIVLYFSFIIFFSYWMIKLLFSKELNEK